MPKVSPPPDSQLNAQFSASELTGGLLGAPPSAGNALNLASRPIAETAFHDFSQYIFLGEPYNIAQDFDDTGIPEGVLYDFEEFVENFLPKIYLVVAQHLPDQMSAAGYPPTSRNNGPVPGYGDQDVAIRWHALFETHLAPMLYAVYAVSPKRREWLDACERALMNKLIQAIRGGSDVWEMSDPAFWLGLSNPVLQEAQSLLGSPESIATGYSFRPYPAKSVNFGLRLVYRQTWTPLGTQPGEIVRTIPLGPKQVEKVSVKMVTRLKEVRSTETVTAEETTRETSESTKDSSEVVAEASKSFKWNVEAEASASYGTMSAKLSAGLGGNSASASKNTKSHLNDTMEKTASKMRRESKVIVSTEREDSFEQAQSSEISNPNEEIAITYVYSRLQRQYEISTHLAEVCTVIFVAEPVPRTIDESWIRRHDWILAKALLDESFADDLAAVKSHVDISLEEAVDSKIATNMTNTGTGLNKDYSALSGGYLPDLYRAPQEFYERELQHSRASKKQGEEYKQRKDRLVRHITDNILHYCRAIWSAEDPEARLMRYYDLEVPMRWEPVLGQVQADGTVQTSYEPIFSSQADTARLSEIINPAGPIGFAGNYAVYYMRSSPRWERLNVALRHLRAFYQHFEMQITNPVATSGAMIVKAAIYPDRIAEGRYRVEFRNNRFWIEREDSPNNWVQVAPPIPSANPVTITTEGLSVVIEDADASRPIQNGDQFLVDVIETPFLEDPDLKMLKWSAPAPLRSEETSFFTRTIIQDIADFIPQVAISLSGELLPNPSWSELTERTRTLIREHYYDYLMAKEHTRRFLLETNNLLVDLDIGKTPALEEFKRNHRAIDVLKAFEETEQTRLNNLRRKQLLREGRHADPDIEKVTVVAHNNDLDPLAVLDEPT